jgi:hypothetical protein
MLVGYSNILTMDFSMRLPIQNTKYPLVAYRGVPEKQTAAQLINKFPALYEFLISKKHFKCCKQRNE